MPALPKTLVRIITAIAIIEGLALSIIYQFYPNYLGLNTADNISWTSTASTGTQNAGNIYDDDDYNSTSFLVTNLKTFSAVYKTVRICVHHKSDIISNSILKEGSWNAGEAIDILNMLKDVSSPPNVTFFDFGANVGAFSLSAAAHGYPVVAIDANIANIQRLHYSLKLNYFQSRVTLIWNAITEISGEPTDIQIPFYNIGGAIIAKTTKPLPNDVQNLTKPVKSLTMNDLAKKLNTRFRKNSKAVLKMDLEGSEYDALRSSEFFFDYFDVHFILMEWTYVHRPPERGDWVVKYLRSKGFEAVSTRRGQQLATDWKKWRRNDVIWRKQK